MRNKVSKHLSRTALSEMIGDGVPKRDLVMGRSSVINSPQSVRAMYLKLKSAYKKMRSSVASIAQQFVATTRKRSAFHRRANLKVKPALIQSPLKQIHRAFPGAMNPRGEWKNDPRYLKAQRAAEHGDGATVQKMARQLLPL